MLRVMFYLADILRPQAQETVSHIRLRKLLQRGEGRARIYRSFCNTEQVVQTLKDYF